MTLKKTVGTLAQGAVSTAVSAVRHPIGTASMAAGLVKGTAEAGVDLVLGVVRGPGLVDGPAKDPAEDRVQDAAKDSSTGSARDSAGDRVADKVDVPSQREGAGAGSAATEPAATQTVDVPREPEVVPKPVPEIDELPEPVVIEADDAPGESFHTEPKAASRDSEHGGPPGDREEAEGYVEEIPSEITGETAEDPIVWTSEASVQAPEAADQTRST
jgi:hypothetical protein